MKLGFIKKLVKPIVSVYNNIICAVKILKNFHRCAIYYLLDMIGYVIYLPFMIFFWIFGIRSIEQELWKMLYKVDDGIKGVTGYNLFKYSNTIMNRCYRCKKKDDKEGGNWFDRMMQDMGKEDNKYSFFEVILGVMLIGLIFYSGYYYFSLKK